MLKNITKPSDVNSTNRITSKENVTKPSDVIINLKNEQSQVKGEIVNVTNNTIKIRVGDQLISGNMNLTGKLNIGEEREFILEIENGKLKMTLVPESAEKLKEQQLINVLKDLGQYSKGNLKLAKELLNNNLPVNNDTIGLLKRSMALFGNEDSKALEKSLLMLKNELQTNMKNATNINSLLDRDQNVTKNLKTIDSLISQLGDDEIALQLKEIFANEFEQSVNLKLNSGQTGESQNKQLQNQVQSQDVDSVEDLVKLITKGLEGEDVINAKEEKALNMTSKEAINIESSEKEITTKESDTLNKNNFDVKQGENDEKGTKLGNLKNLLAGVFEEENTKVNNQSKNGSLEEAIKNKGEALNLSNNLEDQTETTKNVLKSFEVTKELNTPEDLEKHINDKLDKLDKALELIKNTPKESEILKQLENEISTLKDKMAFANEMKNNILVQIPFNINDKTTNGELIVFKDKRKKGTNKNQASALISLDTANLGVFEAYLVKKGENVDIQFRFVNDWVQGLVKGNIEQLNSMLQSKKVNISSVTYKKIDEPFSVTEKEPNIKKEEILECKNTYKFDVRG